MKADSTAGGVALRSLVPLLPMISSFLASVFFWFMTGFAMLPLFLVFEPRYRLLVRQHGQ